MEIGDRVETPRFCGVTINAILTTKEAREQGYTEPTHYTGDPKYDIFGKPLDGHHMIFAAVEKPSRN